MDRRQIVVNKSEHLHELLTEDLCHDFVESLYEARLVSHAQHQKYKDLHTSDARVNYIIQLLVGKDHADIYAKFITWLKEAPIIHEELLREFPDHETEQSRPNPEDGEVLQQSAVVRLDTVDRVANLSTTGESDTESLINGKLIEFTRDKPTTRAKTCHDNFTHSTSPGDTALLVINKKFSDDTRRSGADHDMNNANKLFMWLGYKVDVMFDATKIQFRRKINELRRDSSHYKDHSFVLYISSFGDHRYVRFSDNQFMPINDIIDLLDGYSFPSLTAKPKMVILDCSRHDKPSADKLDLGINMRLIEKDEFQPTKSLSDIVVMQLQTKTSLQTYQPKKTDQSVTLNTNRLPVKSDFVIVRSCFPSYNSFHNKIIGSVTTLVLCEVFYKYCDLESVPEMLRRVRRRLLNIELNGKDGQKGKQVLTVTDSLNDSFWFLPSAH